MFKTRLIISWLIICGLCMASVYFLASELNSANQKEMTEKSVTDTILRVSSDVKVQSARHLQELRKMAEETTLINILSNNNGTSTETLNRLHNQSWSYVEKAQVQFASNIFMLVNSEGKVVARQSNRSNFGDGIKGLPVVKALLQGIFSENVQIFNNELVRMSGAPIVDHNGRVLGGFVSAFKIDKTQMMKMQANYKENFAAFINGEIVVSSNNIASASQLEEKLQSMSDEGYDNNKIFTDTSSDLYFTAIRFSNNLKEYNAGLLCFAELPSKWLAPNSQTAIFIFAGSLIMFVLGVTVTMFASRWIQSKANAQAQIIRSLLKGSSFNGQFHLKKLGPEFSEMSLVIKEMMDNPVRPQTASNSLDTADYEEPLKQQHTIKPPKPPVKRQFTEAEKRALEKRESEQMMNDLTSMVGNIAPKTEPVQPRNPAPADVEPEFAKTQFDTSVKQRVVENLTLDPSEASAPLPSAPAIENNDNNEDYFESVYNEFLNLRGILGQPTHNVNKDKFMANLKGNSKRIMQKSGCLEVKFTVFEKDGKASVKAVPVT